MNTTEMSAIILAGGRSSRMGKNKTLLTLGDMKITETLANILSDMFAECILVTDQPEEYSGLPVRIAPDLFTSVPKNSLRGIHGGLNASHHHYSFVVAGDMPFVAPALVRHLCNLADGYDIVVPWSPPFFHPLAAVYCRSVLPVVDDMLNAGNFRLVSLLESVRSLYVHVDDLRVYDRQLWSLFNINTPEDYVVALKHYESITSSKENCKAEGYNYDKRE